MNELFEPEKVVLAALECRIKGLQGDLENLVKMKESLEKAGELLEKCMLTKRGKLK